MKRLGRRVGFVLASVSVVVVTTGAFAYWRTSGTGAATGGTGQLQPVTIQSIVIGSGRLRPLGPSVGVTVKLDNPNSYAVTIDTVSVGTITSGAAGCGGFGNPTGVSLDITAITGSIAAGSTATFAASASMDASSVNACKSATFSTNLTVAVKS